MGTRHAVSFTPPPHHNRFMALFRDHPGEPVPEENFWTLWCKGRLTEAETLIIRLGATPSGLTSVHLHHPHFLQTGCPSCCPTNSIKALKAVSFTPCLKIHPGRLQPVWLFPDVF